MSTIAIVLDYFRLMHVEQFDALAETLGERYEVVGLELFAQNPEYDFGRHEATSFRRTRLFENKDRGRLGIFRGARRIVAGVLKHRAKVVVISHYQEPYIFLASLILRLLGRRVFLIGSSKFDDYARDLWREVFKWFLYLPYNGAIVASERSGDYLRFLGVPARNIRVGANTTLMSRVRRDAGAPSAPDGLPFAERDFICVARLVPKKNHAMLLDAYARYHAAAVRPRRLVLCGSGPLEAELRARVTALGLDGHVEFAGNLPATEISQRLARSLCLLLPSLSEQFGIVVLEAQAMGLPVLCSIQCGARDSQVRSEVNGFVFEEDNDEGLAAFMIRLGEDEGLWRRMAGEAQAAAQRRDVDRFVESLVSLVERRPAAGMIRDRNGIAARVR